MERLWVKEDSGWSLEGCLQSWVGQAHITRPR